MSSEGVVLLSLHANTRLVLAPVKRAIVFA